MPGRAMLALRTRPIGKQGETLGVRVELESVLRVGVGRRRDRVTHGWSFKSSGVQAGLESQWPRR